MFAIQPALNDTVSPAGRPGVADPHLEHVNTRSSQDTHNVQIGEVALSTNRRLYQGAGLQVAEPSQAPG
jgi:hypothetical protein